MSPNELNNYKWLDAEEVKPQKSNAVLYKAYNRLIKKALFDFMEESL